MAAEMMGFRVTYEALTRGQHRVHVDAGEEGEATITMPSAALAFDVACAAMAAVVEPDPMEVAFTTAAAQDGPRDRG